MSQGPRGLPRRRGCATLGVMVVRAVAFDIGGVLERVAPREHWLGPWRDRLGMSEPEFESAVSRVDPDDRIEVGSLSEAEYS